MEPLCETKPIPRFRIADSQGPRACRLDLRGPAVRTNPICPLRRQDERIPGSLQEMAFLHEKPRIPFRACVVFWCSGILGWRWQKRGSCPGQRRFYAKNPEYQLVAWSSWMHAIAPMREGF